MGRLSSTFHLRFAQPGWKWVKTVTGCGGTAQGECGGAAIEVGQRFQPVGLRRGERGKGRKGEHRRSREKCGLGDNGHTVETLALGLNPGIDKESRSAAGIQRCRRLPLHQIG